MYWFLIHGSQRTINGEYYMKRDKTEGNCPICGKRFSLFCGIRYDHVQKYSPTWKKMVIYRAEEYHINISCFDCDLVFDEYFDHFYFYNQRLKEVKAIIDKSPYFVLEPLSENVIKK
jgi:hypothetical protein